jgi:DNA-binding response OmpR family regulator
VALSSRPEPRERALCIEAGMDEYLAKPMDEDRLEGVLRMVATMHRPGTPARASR